MFNQSSNPAIRAPPTLSHSFFSPPSPTPFGAFPRDSEFSPVRRFCSSGVERRKTGRDGTGRDGTGWDGIGQDRPGQLDPGTTMPAQLSPGEQSATAGPTGLGIFCAGVVFFFWLAGAALEASAGAVSAHKARIGHCFSVLRAGGRVAWQTG